MPNDNSFRRKDLYAGRDALIGATLGVMAALALSQPISIAVTAGVIGTVVGQLFARWRLKRKPSEHHDEPLTTNSVLGFSLWVLCCIGLGAGFAYADGASIVVLAKMGGVMAALVAAAIASTMIAKRLAETKDGDPKRNG